MATAQRSRRRPPPHSVAEYYENPDVRAAMLDYCGWRQHAPAGAVYLAGLVADERPFATWPTHAVRVAPSDVESLLSRGCDISRSLWDHEHLVFMLELDYENVDAPAEPYLRPAETFFKLEAGYRAARRVLKPLAIDPLALMTGRGYQFTGQVRLDDPIVGRLAELAPETPAWHAGVRSRHPDGIVASLDAEHARAAAGLGLLIEYCAHLIMRQAARDSTIPVVFNGTIVGDGSAAGRECVSIDFSHVGDPLDVRHSRVAFSAYQWHLIRPDIFGSLARLGPLVALPRDGGALISLLDRRRSLAAGARAAQHARTSLPEISAGAARLLEAYARSPLAAFHRDFYARRPAPAAGDLEASPPCIRTAFANPNDRLLKPEHVQHVVRVLMARGWHPSSIAALIQGKYEEDHGWGDRWSWMDRQTRAEFDVRVFAGMIATGLDSLVDFNCVSAQEKDLCPRTGCAYDLRRDRERLMNRAES